jgi:Holliday junction resolvasome RuvABC endonuclease subunit
MTGNGNAIVLALDASTTAVGWCVGQGEEYLNSGTYRPSGGCVEARLHAIGEWVRDTLATYDPDLVAIEEPTGDHGNRRTDRLLARVGGMVEGICRSVKPPVETTYVHPMHVKQTPWHKGSTVAAAHLTGQDPDTVSGDEADAIGVWQVALGRLRAHEFNNLISKESER